MMSGPVVCNAPDIRAGRPARMFSLKTSVFSACSLFVLLLAMFSSCAAPGELAGISGSVIEDVPFYPQEQYQCGPASLAAVMNYRGVTVTPREIAAAIYSKTAKGTLDIDMVSYIREKGLTAEAYRGTMEDIKRSINERHPLIVMVDYGFWVYEQHHFMVVVGYTKNGIIVNSGTERLKFIPASDFLRLWEKTHFWTLSVKAGNTE